MKKRRKRRMEDIKEIKEEKRERTGPGPIRKEAAKEGKAIETRIILRELILSWIQAGSGLPLR